MAQLKLLVAAALACGTSAAYAGEFAPNEYFCNDTPATLTTFSEAVAAISYFHDLRTGSAAFDPSQCSGMRLQMAMTIGSMGDPAMMSSSIVGLATSHLGRQMQINAPEARYAGDIDILLQTALTCTVIGASDNSCIVDTITALPDAYLASSPVFCDFAAEPTDATLASDDFQIAGPPPLLCGAVRDDEAWEGTASWVQQAYLRTVLPEPEIAGGKGN